MYVPESFAPLGLSFLVADPRLTPWAAFFRRFAASTSWLIFRGFVVVAYILTAKNVWRRDSRHTY